jgi:L-2-hydroxyglutarate oxidase LhgO
LERVECVVAGAGAIGLAIGRALALSGRDVLIIERNDDFGLETSGRNSEVIHAGIYYTEGSLKARFCRAGKTKLIDYLSQNALPFQLCGKLIVAATPEQTRKLAEIEANACSNGVLTLERLDRARIQDMEPELVAEGGLFSPETGIFDSRSYMRSLVGDIEAARGAIAFQTEISRVEPVSGGYTVHTVDNNGEPFALNSAAFINATGLGASRVGKTLNQANSWAVPETKFARGTYYQVSGKNAFRHLVYPVPEPGGLGIHLTLDLNGQSRFGPDVEWIDRVDYRLSDHRRDHFRSAIARYWPTVLERELQPVYCGIRPKISAQGQPDADFLIAGPETHGMPGLVQWFGIESPGLTASLAIADHVAELLGQF